MLFGSKKVFGLDIGSSSIKIAEMEAGLKGAKLLSFGMIPTPTNAVNGGDFSDPANLGLTVKSLAAEIKLKRKNASVGLYGTAVIVKKISIPRVDLKLIPEQIKWEAEQYIPFDLNSIILAYHVVNPKEASDNLEILLVAAQKEIVASCGSALGAAGFKVGVLEPSGFSLANIFEYNYGKIAGKTIAIVDVGATITNLVVVHNGEVVFCRDMSVGGFNHTNDIQKEMGLSYQEAESMKLSLSSGQPVPDEVHSVVSASNEAVVEEIRNSFEFFAGSSGGLALEHGFFTGGGALTPGLMALLSQSSSVPFEPFNPFVRVTPGNKNFSPAYF
jgi:type IV pilus assembly protein PilM